MRKSMMKKIYYPALILICLFLVGCIPKAKFWNGEIVAFKLNKQIGMITDVFCRMGDQRCSYTVRLVESPQIHTDTHLFWDDGPLYKTGPFVTIEDVQEFELENIK
jgi:hypothetical protein